MTQNVLPSGTRTGRYLGRAAQDRPGEFDEGLAWRQPKTGIFFSSAEYFCLVFVYFFILSGKPRQHYPYYGALPRVPVFCVYLAYTPVLLVGTRSIVAATRLASDLLAAIHSGLLGGTVHHLSCCEL